MSEICFFCTTPYQILAAINIIMSNNEESVDLYIAPHFVQAEVFAERIESLNLFRNIVIVDEDNIQRRFIKRKTGVFNHMQIALSYLYVDNIVESFLISENNYRKIYTSSARIYISRMAQLYFIKHNKNVEIIYFDDGEGSYYNNSVYDLRKSDALIRILLFGLNGYKSVKKDVKKVLYSPELYYELNHRSKEQETIGKIQCLWNDRSIKDKVNYIFGVDNSKLISEKVVIIDTVKEDYVTSDLLDKIYKKIFCAFNKEQVIIKKHPRDKTQQTLPCNYYTEYGIPFEALCINSDMNKKILVALSSTSVIIPKMLLNQEPTVIMLYNLVNIEGEDTERKVRRDNFYQCCRKIYKDPSKFLIPKTMSEFDAVIDELLLKCN